MTKLQAAGVQACIDVMGRSPFLEALIKDIEPQFGDLNKMMEGVDLAVDHLIKSKCALPKRQLVEKYLVGKTSLKENLHGSTTSSKGL